MPDPDRLEALQRKHRPERFRSELCEACGADNLDVSTEHVCDPEKASAYQRQQAHWADPWKENREEQQSALREKLRPVLAPFKLDPEIEEGLIDKIIEAATPHLNVGGPVA